MTVIPAALDIAEDVILPALRRIGEAWWGVAPEGTVGRLLADPDEADHLRRVFVAQHQDGGGQQAPRIGSAGWRGLVVVRCLSARDALARDGRDAADTALTSLTPPEGYSIHARYDRPVSVPQDADGLYTRASQYDITIRRVAAPTPAPALVLTTEAGDALTTEAGVSITIEVA